VGAVRGIMGDVRPALAALHAQPPPLEERLALNSTKIEPFRASRESCQVDGRRAGDYLCATSHLPGAEDGETVSSASHGLADYLAEAEAELAALAQSEDAATPPSGEPVGGVVRFGAHPGREVGRTCPGVPFRW